MPLSVCSIEWKSFHKSKIPNISGCELTVEIYNTSYVELPKPTWSLVIIWHMTQNTLFIMHGPFINVCIISSKPLCCIYLSQWYLYLGPSFPHKVCLHYFIIIIIITTTVVSKYSIPMCREHKKYIVAIC